MSPQPSYTSSLNGGRGSPGESLKAPPGPRPTTPEQVELYQLENSARVLGIEGLRPGETLAAFNRRIADAQQANLRKVREAMAGAN